MHAYPSILGKFNCFDHFRRDGVSIFLEIMSQTVFSACETGLAVEGWVGRQGTLLVSILPARLSRARGVIFSFAKRVSRPLISNN